MIKEDNIKGFKCECVINSGSTGIVYIIYPGVEPLPVNWLERISSRFGVALTVVYVPAEDWNDDLTPWPEPGETKGASPFGGKSSEFLQILKDEIIPETEKIHSSDKLEWRDLIGVSLSGLFTLWQWMICDLFRSIGSLSGSYWYSGFMQWFNDRPVPQKHGKAFFLLGDEEPKSK